MARVFINLSHYFKLMSIRCDMFFNICRIRAIACSNASITYKIKLLNKSVLSEKDNSVFT